MIVSYNEIIQIPDITHVHFLRVRRHMLVETRALMVNQIGHYRRGGWKEANHSLKNFASQQETLFKFHNPNESLPEYFVPKLMQHSKRETHCTATYPFHVTRAAAANYSSRQGQSF